MAEDSIFSKEAVAYLRKRGSDLFFVLSEEGGVVEANRSARNAAGSGLIGENIRNVMVDFTGAFDLTELASDPSKEHLINIGNASGPPQSYYFTFQRVEEHILVFGRLDTEELEIMRREILVLNQDLNNLMRELHKKNAQLKRLNEEKNRFLGMAAHDLRKPIGLSITFSEFLIEETEGLLDAEHAGFLNTIHSSCTFMKRLVDDFLDVSAIEAGKFDLDLQPASIHDVLTQSLAFNRPQAAKKGVELRVQCDETLPRIIMDASKIEQVIINLVSNAVEHTNPDTLVSVSISDRLDSILFSVQDAGPGIPPEEMHKLFKPFGKTSTQKTSGEKSTGLGMLITRKIIDAHGGKIWIESFVGKGTKVCFSMPMNREDNETRN